MNFCCYTMCVCIHRTECSNANVLVEINALPTSVVLSSWRALGRRLFSWAKHSALVVHFASVLIFFAGDDGCRFITPPSCMRSGWEPVEEDREATGEVSHHAMHDLCKIHFREGIFCSHSWYISRLTDCTALGLGTCRPSKVGTCASHIELQR